jgi:hypothetical protein
MGNGGRRTAAGAAATAAAVAAAIAAVAGTAGAQELPTRKPGLWEMTMQQPNAASQVVRQCIDEKTDRQMQQLGQGIARENCSKNTWRRDGERYVSESECRIGSTTAVSRSVFGGDFTTSYRGEVESRFEPPLAGMSQTKTTIAARWVGACPGGWKPGDMEMAGMGRMNVNELGARVRAVK